MMRIAVASQNFRAVTPHAGKARRFLVYEAAADGEVREVARLDLARSQSIHEFRGGVHPLYETDAIIAGSAGPGFVQRMRARGVLVAITGETDPVAAVRAFARGELRPAVPGAMSCDHDHDGEDHHQCGCGQ
jgi:predicted Fe-Mo cluster-binding NifX family protein